MDKFGLIMEYSSQLIGIECASKYLVLNFDWIIYYIVFRLLKSLTYIILITINPKIIQNSLLHLNMCSLNKLTHQLCPIFWHSEMGVYHQAFVFRFVNIIRCIKFIFCQLVIMIYHEQC